jgi:hypothetical protein
LVDEPGSDLPQAARAMLDVLIGMVMMLAEQISAPARQGIPGSNRCWLASPAWW